MKRCRKHNGGACIWHELEEIEMAQLHGGHPSFEADAAAGAAALNKVKYAQVFFFTFFVSTRHV